MTCAEESIQDLVPAASCVSETTIRAFIRARLRSLTCYSSAEVEFANVPLAKARVLVNCVVRDRLNRAERLLALCQARGIRPFTPVLCQSGGLWAFNAPPVVECNGDLSILDGSHRCYAAHYAGIRDVTMTVVKGCSFTRQASCPHDWDDIEIVPFVMDWTERCTSLDHSLFRPVSSIFGRLGQERLPLNELLTVIRRGADQSAWPR